MSRAFVVAAVEMVVLFSARFLVKDKCSKGEIAWIRFHRAQMIVMILGLVILGFLSKDKTNAIIWGLAIMSMRIVQISDTSLRFLRVFVRSIPT